MLFVALACSILALFLVGVAIIRIERLECLMSRPCPSLIYSPTTTTNSPRMRDEHGHHY